MGLKTRNLKFPVVYVPLIPWISLVTMPLIYPTYRAANEPWAQSSAKLKRSFELDSEDKVKEQMLG